MKICTVDGCDKPVQARGMCGMHYRRWRLHGDPLITKPRIRGGCATEGCDNDHYAHGLCKSCYNRLRNFGTIDDRTVENLPGEEWVVSDNPLLAGIFFSNFGRVKSCRKRDEKLLKTVMVVPTHGASAVLMVRPGGGEVRVAQEVLRGFMGNPEGDTTVIHKDGDPHNCRLDNLAWYGRDYLIDKAIAMAEASEHPLADCFLKFWMGDHAAINDWLALVSDKVRGYIYSCLRRINFPYWMEIDDLVQQSLTDIFIGLYRGMFKGFETLEHWVLSVAKGAYLRFVKVRLTASIEHDFDDGDTGFLPDLLGICHPSAELEAIYREEVLCE